MKWYSLAYIFISILLTSCFSQENIIKDDLTGLRLYTSVDVPPKYIGGSSFTTDFMTNFSFKYEQDEMRQYSFVVQYVIDTRGNLIGARIAGKKEKEQTRVEREIIKTLYKLQNWEPAQHKGKKVNTLITTRLNIGFR